MSAVSDTEGVDVVLSVILVISYILLAAFCSLQISRLLYYRHALRSFQFGFLCLCLLWCLLRIVFFMAWESLSPVMLRVIFQLPVDLQFMTFSLLVLFFAFLLHQFEWRTKRDKAVAIYAILNGSLIIATGVYLQQLCKTGECISTPGLERMHHIYTLCNFYLLVLAFAYVSFEMYRNDNPAFARDGSDAAKLAHVAWVIFLSRLVYNIMVTISDDFSIYNYFSNQVDIVIFKWWGILLLALWEIVPSLAVLIFFREIPPTTTGLCHRRCLNIYYVVGDAPTSRPEHTLGFSGLSWSDRILYIISRLFCCPPNLEAVQETDTQSYFPPAYDPLFEGMPNPHPTLLTEGGHPLDGFGSMDTLDGGNANLDLTNPVQRTDYESQYYGTLAGSQGPLGGRYYVALRPQSTSAGYQSMFDERYTLYSQDPSSFSMANVGSTPRSPSPHLLALGNTEGYAAFVQAPSMGLDGQFGGFLLEEQPGQVPDMQPGSHVDLRGPGSINSRE